MEDKTMLPSVFKSRQSNLPGNLVNDFFSDSFLPSWFNWNYDKPSTPAVNVEEKEKEYVIEVAAPGIDKKDFNVTINNGLLTVSSSHEEKSKEKQNGYVCREFNYSSFSRSFELPEDVEADKIKASHKNGILSINIPKSGTKVEKVHEIKIS